MVVKSVGDKYFDLPPRKNIRLLYFDSVLMAANGARGGRFDVDGLPVQPNVRA